MPIAAPAPRIWAPRNGSTELGAMPAKVSVKMQPVAGELLRNRRRVRGDVRGPREGGVGLEHHPLDGLLAHHPGELLREAFGGSVQHRIRGEQPLLAALRVHAALPAGSSSAISASTRERISSRIGRTDSMPCPAGSSSSQSS